MSTVAEAGRRRALALGESFGIVALSRASMKRQAHHVRRTGLGARHAGSGPVAAALGALRLAAC